MSSVTSIPASRVRVESMQTVQLQDSELFANVDQTMLVILSVNVVWNLVQPTHVESMLIVLLLEGKRLCLKWTISKHFHEFSNAVCKCRPNYTGDPYTNCNFDPCSSNPCGQGAFCENNGRAAVCKCPPKHIGDPYVSCRLDPCQGDACGPNAECTRSGDRAVCSCFRGYIGSPYRLILDFWQFEYWQVL